MYGSKLPRFTVVIYYGIGKVYQVNGTMTCFYASTLFADSETNVFTAKAKAIELSYLSKTELHAKFGFVRLDELKFGSVFTIIDIRPFVIGEKMKGLKCWWRKLFTLR